MKSVKFCTSERLLRSWHHALLKRCTSKGYRGFESLPHRQCSLEEWLQCLSRTRFESVNIVAIRFAKTRHKSYQIAPNLVEFLWTCFRPDVSPALDPTRGLPSEHSLGIARGILAAIKVVARALPPPQERAL